MKQLNVSPSSSSQAGEHEKEQSGEPSHIHWHPAFVEAIKLELEEYMNSLEFYPELQLTTEPLRIDCIVIKKAKGVAIKKNIAAIFRQVNIIEYKNPDDYVSVADFYKVYAYACLYAYLKKVPITSITISFIESRYPRNLFNHLQKVRHYKVAEKQPGIYTVTGDILPIQVIESHRLSENENLWLKGLSKRLKPLTAIQIINKAARQDKAANVTAYLDVLSQANLRAIEEAIKMSAAVKSFYEVLERTGIAAKLEARAEARGEERNALNVAKKMIKSGFSLETITSITELDPEKVKKLYQQ